MRLARKLFLLAAMALAAMALTAGTASAQEEAVEIENEVSGLHCDYDAANCEHHVVGTSSLLLHQFGTEIPISACNDEFVASLDENGSGFIHEYENDAAASGSCTRVACNGVGEPAEETEWDIFATGEYTGAQTEEGHLSVRFCLDDETNVDGAGRHCDAEIQVHNHGNHSYGFEAETVICPIIPGVFTELNGSWESEATPGIGEDDIEIIH